METEYKKEDRKKLGIFFTPKPIVDYIVSAVDWSLKDIGFKDGLINKDVKILEPAMGEGIFISGVLEKIAKNYKGNDTKDLVENHILKDIYGFEILKDVFETGKAKIKKDITSLFNYKFNKNSKLNLYLTNTLDDNDGNNEVKKIRKEKPINVIIGNPPYNASSKNNTDFIKNELKLKEIYGRIKGTSDDYVKFIRFADYKLENVNKGVIGFITNNSFLDGLSFETMRKHLYNTFNKIYIINLHGDQRRDIVLKEKNDQNVFGIKQGVAIEIFIKDGSKEHNIYYKDLIGTKEEKFKALEKMVYDSYNEKDINPFVEFKKLEINNKFDFIPRNFKLKDSDINITNVFNFHFGGIITCNDNYLIDFSKDNLKEKMKAFLETNHNTDIFIYKNEHHSWHIKSNSRFYLKDFDNIVYNKKLIIPINYRIFDTRYIYYDCNLLERNKFSLYKIIKNKETSLQLYVNRKTVSLFKAFVGKNILDDGFFDNVKVFSFPLFSSSNKNDFNINKQIIDDLNSKFNLKEKSIQNYKDINPFLGFKNIKINDKFDFIPRNFNLKETDIQITNIFNLHVSGVETGNDKCFVNFSSDRLEQNILSLLGNKTNSDKHLVEDAYKKQFVKKSSNTVKLKILPEDLKFEKNLIIEFSYRIFDIRKLYYDKTLLNSPVYNLYNAIMNKKPFLQLCMNRRTMNVFKTFVINNMLDINLLGLGRNFSFPLYSFPNPTDFNIKKPILDTLTSTFNKPITAEDVFYYVIGVLNSKQYQEDYKESLAQDFPYIPFDTSLERFYKIAKLGKEIAELETYQYKDLVEDSKIVYNKKVKPNYTITKNDYKTIYDESKQELKLNDYIKITNVPKEVFEFEIGDYKVIQRFIKYRLDYYNLPKKDFKMLCKNINTIKKLIEVLKEVDDAYKEK